MKLETQSIEEQLLSIEAVKLNVTSPFTWASGWKSPIYCDNRKALSFPALRAEIADGLATLCRDHIADAEILAGVATAGIPWGALVADRLGLPFIYVRPKPKEHGTGSQIEGVSPAGRKVIVVEDLISTAKSSLLVCDVLKQAGADVQDMISVFTYGFPQAEQALNAAGIKLYSLANYEHLISAAENTGRFSAEEITSLLQWRSNPSNWR